MPKYRPPDWPRGAGRVRRPVRIRTMWLYGLDTPPACHLTMAQILGLPGAWPMLMAGMRQNPAIWTDQPPPEPVTLMPVNAIPYVKNGEVGYMGPSGEWISNNEGGLG